MQWTEKVTWRIFTFRNTRATYPWFKCINWLSSNLHQWRELLDKSSHFGISGFIYRYPWLQFIDDWLTSNLHHSQESCLTNLHISEYRGFLDAPGWFKLYKLTCFLTSTMHAQWRKLLNKSSHFGIPGLYRYPWFKCINWLASNLHP